MNTSTGTASRRGLWLSALLLCLVSPFMAEVLSSNQTPWSFVLLSWGLIPVYGFPVLLLREWALRRGVSLVGLLIAGFGYGLFNEGLIAKTLFLNQKVPWNLFDGRIGWGGVNWGWLLVICTFHALFSVVTPLLLVEKLRPQTAGQVWLSKRSIPVLLAVTVLISTGYHSNKPTTAPVGFYLLWGAITLLTLAGSLFHRSWLPSPKAPSTRALVWIGAFILPALLLLSGGFAHGLPFPAFALVWLSIAAFYEWLVSKGGADGTLALGMGAYAGMSAMNVVFAHPIAKVIGLLTVITIIFWLKQNACGATHSRATAIQPSS